MDDDQSQKNKNVGIAQQAKDNGTNICINGETTLELHAKKEEKDIGIIAEILKTIFNSSLDYNHNINDLSDNVILSLSQKISLNFDEGISNEVNELFILHWNEISIVEKFIQNNTQLSSSKINKLIAYIKEKYRQAKNSSSSSSRVENASFFYTIALNFLAESKKENSEYVGNAIAIILYFFQMCEIGEKTVSENVNQRKLLS